MRRTGYFITVGLACCLSIYALFYWQINSHFSLIFGDELDTVIQSSLISHWYDVLGHHRVWNTPAYFYPHSDVLGYNDGYFLNGMVASLYRLAGFNYLASNELCLLTFKAIGFLSMTALLNRLQRRWLINLVGAALFTLSINVTNQAGHGQLFSVSFAPLLALLLVDTVAFVDAGKRVKALLTACAFFVLFNALLMTSFYMAWFFGLFLIMFTIAKVALDFSSFKTFICKLFSMKMELAAALLVFCVTLIPFLYVYLPALSATGGQDYGSQLAYSLRPNDILNTGPASLIWGDLLSSFSERFPSVFRENEFRVGFTPDVVAMFFVIVVVSISKRACFPKSFIALVCATAIGLLLPISINHHSLWFFVNHLIPGAKGMRVIARFYLFLAFPIAILAALFVARAMDAKPSMKAILVGVLLLLCASQVARESPVRLNVDEQMAQLANVPAPPANCKSFFAVNPLLRNTSTDRKYRQNVGAMVIAETFDIPTLNGVASFLPSDWAFADTPAYLPNVGLYIETHRLQNVCSYDLTANKWQQAEPASLFKSAPPYQIGTTLNFSEDRALDVLGSGWSTPEPWGVWSDGELSTVFLLPSGEQGRDLKMTFNARAFLTPTHDKLDVKVSVNGHQVGVLTYGAGTQSDGTQSVVIPYSVAQAKDGALVVVLNYVDAISPTALGLSSDTRKLGIGISSLKVDSE
jgi:hypothetical protein